MGRLRLLPAVLAILSVAVAGCTGSGGSAAVTIPDSPVGRQLRWYMEAVNRAPLAESELAEHLSQDFMKGVPPEEFNTMAKSLADLKLEELSDIKPTALVGQTLIPGQSYKTEISVDGDGKIDYLLLTPN
ncbi:Cpe/LpqF family protein [Sphaerisporangium sp. NBC_01403]|uniref:Cpe/LpqF family protein n=1 Tax=Sphaerisporangium sp. NBC_01403 TaxID=2903599 RepID=UPI00325098F6